MNKKPLEGKRVLVTGGTGSLGQAIVRRLLTCEMGRSAKIIVFSRDEAKQHYMRLSYLNRRSATDEVIYSNFKRLLTFRIGDIRDYASLTEAAAESDVIINAAALKQVPSCEYFPYQAVLTNILGAQNIVRAVREGRSHVKTVVGVSTDKACNPINVMGMTKALMERIFVEGNIECPKTRFICVRYGNVIASRGSVVPLFLEQISQGGPVTVTTKEMTRFLLTLDQSVDTVFAAICSAKAGEIYVPNVNSARIIDIAGVLINGRKISISYTGIRPGEKVHEILVSEEECRRTVRRDGYYVICPMLPELPSSSVKQPALYGEYSSGNVTFSRAQLKKILDPYINSNILKGIDL